MATEFKLPSLGDGIDSADVAEVLVSVGDTVENEQILMELETDKAVVELQADFAGKITEIKVNDGDSIAVGDVVLVFEASEATSESDQAAPDAASDSSQQSESAEAEAPAAETQSSAAQADEPQSKEASSQPFEVPTLGDGIDSADVAEILVSVGDELGPGDILMELETDKAVVELPLESGGVIEEILIEEGDTIKVGQHVLTVKVGGAAPASSAPNASASGSSAPTSKPSAPATPAASSASPAKEPTIVETTAVAAPASQTKTDGPPPPAAPSTRRLARELGVNLREVSGSGPGGRILTENVHAFVKQRMTSPASNLPAVSGAAASGGMALAPPPLPDFANFGDVRREKLSKLGRTAAENLTTAWHVIPHVTQQDVCDITDLEAARKKFGAGAGAKGPKVTMTAIAMKALATCLEAFPKFNSSLDPETMEIVYKDFINIGCAVDTPYGLVVPVIKACNEKSILEIASDLTDLAGKARDRKLAMNDMMGATCTVTNLGGIGGTAFTPIVNYPEVAILGMCRGQKQPAIQDGQLVERLMLPLSLSYDHRVINGADAAKFLVAFKNMLADPFQLMASA